MLQVATNLTSVNFFTLIVFSKIIWITITYYYCIHFHNAIYKSQYNVVIILYKKEYLNYLNNFDCFLKLYFKIYNVFSFVFKIK